MWFRLSRGLSSDFWWPRKANHVKYTEECVVCVKECFNQKKISKRVEHEFAMMSLSQKVKKTIHVVVTLWLSNKEKFPNILVCKNDHADSLLELKMSHHHWFSCERLKYKQCFLLPTSGKNHLIYEMSLIYIIYWIFTSDFILSFFLFSSQLEYHGHTNAAISPQREGTWLKYFPHHQLSNADL